MTLVAKTLQHSTNGDAFITTSINTVGANLIIAVISWYNGNSPVMAWEDSQGNTWTHLTDRVNASGHVVSLYYKISPSTDSAHTFNLHPASQMYPAYWVGAFSDGSITPAFDAENGGTSSGGVASFQGGSISPSFANNVAFAGMAIGDSVSGVGINSSYTSPDFVNTDGTNYVGLAVAYKIGGLGGTENPTYSWTSNSHVAMENVDFTASGSGGGGSVVGSYYSRLIARMDGGF